MKNPLRILSYLPQAEQFGFLSVWPGTTFLRLAIAMAFPVILAGHLRWICQPQKPQKIRHYLQEI